MTDHTPSPDLAAQMARLRELLAKATPGPWRPDGKGFRQDTRNGGEFIPLMAGPHWIADIREYGTNHELIAEAITALPTLLSALEARAPASGVAPEGYKLVPLEPTEEMATVGADARWRSAVRDANSVREIYRAMLAAAPATPGAMEAATEIVDCYLEASPQEGCHPDARIDYIEEIASIIERHTRGVK